MTIFINNKSTKFRQITLRIKRFIHKRKVIPFFCLSVYRAAAPPATRAGIVCVTDQRRDARRHVVATRRCVVITLC